MRVTYSAVSAYCGMPFGGWCSYVEAELQDGDAGGSDDGPG
jgi:hypothetical protein